MRSSRQNLGYRFARVLGAGVVLLAATGAFGQVNRLPQEVLTSSGLSGAEKSSICEFVRDEFARLKSDDPSQAEDARRSLESPFERDDPTIVFRLEYERCVILEVRPLLADGPTQAVMGGLLVAGKCGTPQAVDLLSDVVTDDKLRVAVRTAGVAGLHEVIRGVGAGRVREEQGRAGVKAIGEALGDADDAVFAKACVFALNATERGALHQNAAQAINTAIPKLAAKLVNAPQVEDPTGWAQAIQLSLRLVYTHILQVSGRPDAAFAKASVESAGYAMAFAATRLNGSGPEAMAGTTEGAQLARLVGQAEQLAIIAGRGLRGATARQAALENAWNASLEAGDATEFMGALDAMLEWIENATGLERADLGL